MKKYAFMLLPLLVASLVGCNKSSSSESTAMINKAKSIKFIENYSDKLSGLEPADVSIYNNIENRFYSDAKTASYGEISYDEYQYVNSNQMESKTEYAKYTLLMNSAYKMERIRKGNRENAKTRKKEKLDRTTNSESFYDESRSRLYTYDNYDGENELFDCVDLAGRSQSEIDNYRNQGIEEAYESTAGYVGECNVYVTKKGYLAYYEYSYEFTIPGDVQATEKTQIIIEFNSEYQLISGTFYDEVTSKYDMAKEEKVANTRTNYSLRLYFTASYGEKESDKSVVSKMEKLYGKPYFYYADCSFANAEDYETMFFLNPQKVRVISYAKFNSFYSMDIDVSTYVNLYAYSDLYGMNDEDFEITKEKYKLKNTKQLRYDSDNNLFFRMNSISDCVYVDVTYELKNNKPVLKSGYVNIVSQEFIESTFVYM